MKLNDIEKAAEEAGWDVEWTVNLHLTKPDAKSVLVETFDRDGFPSLYNPDVRPDADSIVQVGGDLGEPFDCGSVEDVMKAVETIQQGP